MLVWLIKRKSIKNSIPLTRPKSMKWICNYFNDRGYNRYLEIGSAYGFSLSYMYKKSNGSYFKGIERDEHCFNICSSYLSRFNNVCIIHNDGLLHEESESYDFIYVDASKLKMKQFFEKYAKNLSSKGTMVFDNIYVGKITNQDKKRKYENKIREFIDFIESNEMYSSEVINIEDGLLVVKKP
jgi:predicted O-methyltransferase YrrM